MYERDKERKSPNSVIFLACKYIETGGRAGYTKAMHGVKVVVELWLRIFAISYMVRSVVKSRFGQVTLPDNGYDTLSSRHHTAILLQTIYI